MSQIKTVFIGLLAVLFFSTGAMAGSGAAEASYQKAVFAGGCFWCMQAPFDQLPGVISTTVGYTGGKLVNPTYEQVSHEETGHAEAVEVLFDPKKITYEKILDVFWHQIDPTTVDAQFVDVGNSYRTAIFYQNDEQKKLAEASQAAWEKKGTFKKPIVTQIVSAGPFYKAEDYHQSYYKKNPVRYNFYRSRSGRDRYLTTIWGKSDH